MAHWSAPGSELAQIVTPLAFALVLPGGLILWFGVGALSLLGRALQQLVRGQGRSRSASPFPATWVPPGHGAFLALALLLGLLAGLVVGLVPESSSFLRTCAAHGIAAGGYGLLLRALARKGLLPFPEPS